MVTNSPRQATRGSYALFLGAFSGVGFGVGSFCKFGLFLSTRVAHGTAEKPSIHAGLTTLGDSKTFRAKTSKSHFKSAVSADFTIRACCGSSLTFTSYTQVAAALLT